MNLKIILSALALIVTALQLPSVQAASYCSDLFVNAEDIEIQGNSTKYFYFPIENTGNGTFEVYEIYAWTDSDHFNVYAVDYSDEVEADESGELTIKVVAEGVNSTETGTAYIEARGYMGEEYCHYTEVGRTEFEVTVTKGSSTHSICDEIEIHASNVYMDEDSTETVSFTIENTSGKDFDLYGIEAEEGSSYFDAFIYSRPSLVRENDTETFRVKIESNRVSGGRQGSITLRAKGEFEGGTYCSYDEGKEETFTVYVENTGSTTEPEPEAECPDIGLDTHTVRAKQGTTAYTTFYLHNYSDEDFLIDYISIFDLSRNLKAEENGYEKEVPAFGSSYINAKVKAYDYADLGEETGYVEVKGHFQNGESCFLSGSGLNAFPIAIEEPESEIPDETSPLEQGCSSFSLTFPATAEISGNGAVPITIDNRTSSRATVRLHGPGLTVNPSLISIPKNSAISESIYVSSKLSNTTLVYEIEAIGCNTEKRTQIVSEAEQPVEPEPEPQEPEQNGLAAAIAAGFALLSDNLAIVGLAILIVIVLYFVLKQ